MSAYASTNDLINNSVKATCLSASSMAIFLVLASAPNRTVDAYALTAIMAGVLAFNLVGARLACSSPGQLRHPQDAAALLPWSVCSVLIGALALHMG